MSPTYDYSGETAVRVEDLYLEPGRRVTTTRYYSGEKLVLITNSPDTPVPVRVLKKTAIDATPITIDQGFNTLRIVNKNIKPITVYFNGDSANTISLNSALSGEGSWIELDNEKHTIGQIVISSPSSTYGLVEVINYNK